MRKVASESPSTDSPRATSIVVSTESTDEASLPAEWANVNTQVSQAKAEEPKTDAHIDVSDLMSELSLDTSEPQLQVDLVDSSEMELEPTSQIIDAEPDTKADPMTLQEIHDSADQTPAPVSDSLDPNLISLPEDEDSLSTQDSLEERSEPPPLDLAEAPNTTEASTPEELSDADNLFADLNETNPTPVLSQPPPPLSDERRSLPRRPSVPARPVTDAPLEGEDPFAHLNTASRVTFSHDNLEKAVAKNPAEESAPSHERGEVDLVRNNVVAESEPAPQTGDNPFDDLAALSAQVKSRENQVRAKTGHGAASHSVPPPPLPPDPPTDPEKDSPVLSPEPPTVDGPANLSSDKVSHGLVVDFKSTQPKPVERPTTSALPDISEIKENESRPTSSELSLPPKREISSHPDDENLANIIRPVVIIPLSRKGIYEIVHPIAISMTASEKRQRVDGKKSLVLSGLLLQQAKLLRERLQNQEIECRIADPATLNTGINLAAVSPDLNQATNVFKRVVIFALIALVVGGASLFGYNEVQKQKVNENVREAITRLREKAEIERAKIKADELAKQAKISQQERTIEEIRYGGRTKQWWTQYISALRRQERTAPAGERTKIRAYLIDAERKAKALGIKAQP
ncbi:MAG: hypothetical protein VYC39_06885 [Myxococcota bacterium]|nr:hypothetical protein [Myxococcota bacterium]